MRFTPPRIEVPSELGWLLGAAFAPALPAAPADPEGVGELARRFDLSPRIVARHGASALAERLGAAAAEMVGDHRRSVALALAAERTAGRLAALAAERGLELIFLKGCALQLMAAGPAGWRPAVDLDVLLAPAAGEELHRALVAAGWPAAAEADNPQHLPPIVSPEGTPVDVHFRLRGVRVAAAPWATASELLGGGLCRPAGLGESTWLPAPPVLAAHLAVHALEQHGHRPATYPLLRAVADLADLAATGDGDELAAAAGRLVGDSLAGDETRALFALARTLAAGRIPAGGEQGGAAILLRHIVAGTLDPVYRRGLALDHTAGRLRQARREGQLMRYIARKLQGPGEPAAAGSGASARGPGSLSRRLLRLLRLVARFLAATAARLRRPIDR